MPLGFLAIRRAARHCVADNVTHMLGTHFKIAANGGRQAVELITHNLTTLVAADATHRLSALAIAQVEQRAVHEARSRALPQVGAAPHGKRYAQFSQAALEGE